MPSCLAWPEGGSRLRQRALQPETETSTNKVTTFEGPRPDLPPKSSESLKLPKLNRLDTKGMRKAWPAGLFVEVLGHGFTYFWHPVRQGPQASRTTSSKQLEVSSGAGKLSSAQLSCSCLSLPNEASFNNIKPEARNLGPDCVHVNCIWGAVAHDFGALWLPRIFSKQAAAYQRQAW